MKQIDIEISRLREVHAQMWELVDQQTIKAFDALRTNDRDLAREVVAREKMVNTQELLVDQNCENFIAIFSPVAMDLRFVISLMKINNNLERIGDFAESTALFVLHHQTRPIDEELMRALEINTMIDYARQMMELSRRAFATEDTKMASRVLALDDTIDQINYQAVEIIANHISKNPETTIEMLHLLAVIRRIERIGDRLSNIAEDIVFYVDAKELRHREK